MSFENLSKYLISRFDEDQILESNDFEKKS